MSKFNFFIILLIGFVDYLGIGLVYPIFAVLLFDPANPIIHPDASPTYRGAMLGILIALTPLSQFFSAPALGVFSDRSGRKKALAYGIATGCIGYVLAVVGIWVHSLALLFLYRLLAGVSDGTAAVAQAALADLSTEQNKARRFALLNSSLGLGFTLGPFIGGKLAASEWLGYALPFAIAGVMSLVNFILVLWKLPETRSIDENTSKGFLEGINNIRKVVLWPNLRWLFIAGFALSFGWTFFNEFIPVLLKERFLFTINDIGNFYAVSGGWYAFSAGAASVPLLKFFSPEKLVIKSLFGCAACMLVFAFIRDPQWIWWALPLLMYMLAIAYPTATAIVSNRTSPERQGEVLGTYQSVGALAMGISPLFIGGIVGLYPAFSALGGAVSMLFAGIAFWIGSRKEDEKNKLTPS